MATVPDSGWTMESFLRWTCGPRALAYLAVDVDLARRSVALLSTTRNKSEIGRLLALLARRIQGQAERCWLRSEGELAGAIAAILSGPTLEAWKVEQVRLEFAELDRRVRSRLAHAAKLLGLHGAPSAPPLRA
jgi:hypothetical protein